ncbi:MAG: tyrosine-type recombinase/integrase [Vicingaceae bacterium]
MISFKNYLQSRGNSKSTVENYNGYILDFISYLDRDNTEPEQASAKEVMAYQNVLTKRGYENKTRNTRLTVIKHFFNYQIEIGQRLENPVQHLKIKGGKKQKLYPILEKHELERIYHNYEVPSEEDEQAKRNWFKAVRLGKARNKVIIGLMIYQGLTTAEVNKMQLNDLKLKEGQLLIRGGRKSNERLLELKAHQIMGLMEYVNKIRAELLSYSEEPTDYLFISSPPIGKKYKRGKTVLHIWKRFSQEIREINSDFINFKQVRTSVITHWLKEYNLRKVQYMAGHRYVSSTEAYLVNQTEDLQKEIDAFHPF